MTTERVAIVTGGNRGIGKETAKQLASAGFRVVLTSRERAAGEAAKTEIVASTPNAVVDVMELDLASLDSVRAFTDAFAKSGRPLHLLVNNAGVYDPDRPRSTTRDGFEAHFGTNHLGHFLLTLRLRDTLVASAPARVLTMSSGLIFGGPGRGAAPHIDFDDLAYTKNYQGEMAYKRSKLANYLFACELHRRESGSGIASNAIAPMVVAESVAAARRGFGRFFAKYVLPLFPVARTAAQAAANTVWAATDPQFEKQGGLWLEDMKRDTTADRTDDPAIAKRLWEVSLKSVGLAAT